MLDYTVDEEQKLYGLLAYPVSQWFTTKEELEAWRQVHPGNWEMVDLT